MPYPKWLVYNVLQSYEPLSIVVLKLSLPFNWVVLLLVVHIESRFANMLGKPLSTLILSWFSMSTSKRFFQVPWLKIATIACTNCFMHSHCDIIDKLAIFIYWISPSSVCKDLKHTCALHDWRLELACVIIWSLQKYINKL
jgi:hypothetical protein